MPEALSEHELTALIDATGQDLLGPKPGPAGRDPLRLTGLEVAAFIGAKVLVPIVVSYISKVMYDNLPTKLRKTDVASARRAIASQPLQPRPLVPGDVVKAAIVGELVRNEGLPAAVAEDVVARAYARVAERAVAPDSPVIASAPQPGD